MTMKCKDVNRNRLRHARRSAIFCGTLAAAFALAGCGGAGENANKMTSFSTAESAASKAELFSLPADQMSHIQIYTVVQAPLERTFLKADYLSFRFDAGGETLRFQGRVSNGRISGQLLRRGDRSYRWRALREQSAG
jgi:hypothetical protein